MSVWKGGNGGLETKSEDYLQSKQANARDTRNGAIRLDAQDVSRALREPGHDSWAGYSWKYGGAPAWVTGSYDPELNLTYWGTGNPAPGNYGGQRLGDNRYSNSMLALDADTGKLKWNFQFTPHDLWDYDATHTPILIRQSSVSRGRPAGKNRAGR
jgi:glucose dehydrogenase